MYDFTLDQYNAHYGKLQIAGTFEYIVPSNVAYSGTVNVGDGVIFQRGGTRTVRNVSGDFGQGVGNVTKSLEGYISNDFGWIGNLTWESLDGGNPPHIKFTPTAPLTDGFMCAIKVYYEEGVSRDDRFSAEDPGFWGQGLGETAVFVEFADSIELAMWTGVVQDFGFYQYDPHNQNFKNINGYRISDGWALPNDGSKSIVCHFRDLISERGWAGRTWADVVSIRIVFQNAWDDMRVKVKNLYFYKPVLEAPLCTATATRSFPTEVEYDVSVTNPHGVGISYIEGWYNTPGGPKGAVGAEAYFTNPPTTLNMIEFQGLDSAERGENVIVFDSYENKSRVADAWGTNTNLSSSLSYNANRPKDLMSIDLTLTGGVNESSVRLRWIGVWQTSTIDAPDSELEGQDKLVYAENLTAENIYLPYTLNRIDLPWDSTGGGTWRIKAFGERIYNDGQDLSLDDNVEDTYYFDYDEKFFVEDGPPKIKGIDGKGFGNTIQLVAWAWDNTGLTKITFYEIIDEVHDIKQVLGEFVIDQVEGSYPQSANRWLIIPTTPDAVRKFVATCVDVNGVESDFYPVITVRSDGSDITETGDPNVYVIPNFEGFVLDDSSVVLKWTSWNNYLVSGTEFKHLIDHFKVYRKKVGEEPTFSLISDKLSSADLTYHDTSLTTPGVYEYRLVGVDCYGDPHALGTIVSVGSGPTISYIPFVEEILSALPKWLAASPRNYTLDALLKDS